MKKIRFHQRKNVEELIQPIISLELVEMFYKKKPQFENLPLKFISHQQYRDIWIPLFLYEVFSSMIN